MRGEGSKAVWNFSENLSGPFPKHFVPILSALFVRVLESNIKYNVLGLQGCLCLFLCQCNDEGLTEEDNTKPQLSF